MARNLFGLGCFVLFLSGSSAIHAREIILYDPGDLPNIKVSCDAIRYVKATALQSEPFQLHLDVFFREKYAIIRDGSGHNNIQMAVTGMTSQHNQQAENIVLSSVSASTVVNTKHKEFVLVDITENEEGEYSIIGRNCTISPLE